MTFNFIENAKRESTPLLIGLVGPSGCGKTKSALRLGSGIQRVRGGKLVGIDTEARRMLHYANEFNLTYLEFSAPFSSLRYMEALKAAAQKAEGGVVIVDSMSHEHEGEGGYLEYHETELDDLVKKSNSKDPEWKIREKQNMRAWIKPAGARRRLINTILQLNCAFIFCFRAKEKLKLISGQNPIELGWQAIAGEEFAFEMTVRCLLQPGSKGVPDWSPEAFKNGVPKRIDDHARLLPDGQQLNEDVGERLARWAKGEAGLTLENAIHDIEAAPTLDGLKFKHAAAYRAFGDPESRSKIDAAKDKRKAALTQQTAGGQPESGAA